MAEIIINLGAPKATVTVSDTLKITQNNLRIIIAPVSADVTMLVDLIGSGNFRTVTTTIKADDVVTTEILPAGTVLKFTGGSIEASAV